jgi:hypothetical protein
MDRIGAGLSHEKSFSCLGDRFFKKNIRSSLFSAKIEERMRIGAEFCERPEPENRAFIVPVTLLLLKG